MNETTSMAVGGAERATHPTPRAGRRLRWRRLRWHHLWLVPGLAIAIFANQLGNANGVGILVLVAFGIAPDLPRLLGSRGRPLHNLLHRPVAAVAAVAIAATGIVPVVWTVGAAVWLSHVVIGRAVGDVPRSGRVGSDA